MSVLLLAGRLPQPGRSAEVTSPMFRPLRPRGSQEAPGQRRSPPKSGRSCLALLEALVVVEAGEGEFS